MISTILKLSGIPVVNSAGDEITAEYIKSVIEGLGWGELCDMTFEKKHGMLYTLLGKGEERDYIVSTLYFGKLTTEGVRQKELWQSSSNKATWIYHGPQGVEDRWTAFEVKASKCPVCGFAVIKGGWQWRERHGGHSGFKCINPYCSFNDGSEE